MSVDDFTKLQKCCSGSARQVFDLENMSYAQL